MEPVTLYPSKAKNLLLVVGSLVFVAGGVFLILRGEKFMAWATTIFFGLCSGVGIALMLPGAASLELHQEGFTQRSFSRAWTVRWQDVQEFSVGHVGPNKVVMIDFVPNHQPQSTGKQIARALAGHDGSLANAYGMKAEALADLLREWKCKCQSQQSEMA